MPEVCKGRKTFATTMFDLNTTHVVISGVMTKKRIFGELELAILSLFKSHEELTVKEVLKMLGEDDKYTTIMTVMSRLVEKKELKRERIGLQYRYSINASKKSAPSGLLERLKQKIFGGKSASMISYLIESGDDITEDELAEMEKLIQEMKRTRK